MTDETSRKEELRAQAEKLRVENNEQAEVEKANKQIALNQLAAIQGNTNLAAMYAESANIGSENLGGSSPLLKLHATGKSTGNTLADGSEPSDGALFYKPTQEQFPQGVNCRILTISRGFKAPGMDGQKDGKLKLTQIMGGLILAGDEYKPFVTYLTGVKLSPMWEFGKEARAYTHAKPFPIPMFALTVKLSSKKVKTDFGMNWTLNFEILKNEDGSPVLITDPGEFTFVKDSVDMIKEIIDGIIKTKEKIEEVATQPAVATGQSVDVAEEIPGQEDRPW